jgi:adenine-specific DNA-methyltransferase
MHPKANRRTGGWGVEYRVYLDPSVRLIDEEDDEADDDDKLFDRTSKSKSFWWGAEFSTDVAGREFKSLFDNLTTDYPKSPFLMERIIHMATRPGDIVLDFFGGFSTTAQAVYNLAASEGQSRRFVMVQLPEPCAPDSKEYRAGYGTIADLSRERIRRAALQAQKRSGLERDWGFRSFVLDRSCFNQWVGDLPEGGEEPILLQLAAHADHVAPEASEQDLLFELLLKDGFTPATVIEKREVANTTVYSVADGELLICLEKKLNGEIIDALAQCEASRVICLDAGFQGNDQLKANAVQTFKARARSRETAVEFRTV